MQRFSLIILISSLVLLIAACAPEKKNPDSAMVKKLESIKEMNVVKKLSVEEQLQKLAGIKDVEQQKFRLGKGDKLDISVYGETDLGVKNMPVRPDGMISFPLIGDVQAEGKTVSELKQLLTEKLNEYVRSSKVAIIVQEFASLNYTVAGEVVRPGSYPLITDISLAKAVAMSGGLNKGTFHATSVELADLTHSFIAREGKVLPVDFVRLFRGGDMRFDIPLQPGDYIYIPSGLAKSVYILGEVTKADLFAFNEGFTVSSALTQANGFTPDADLSNIHVVRGSLSNPQLFILDMAKVLNGEENDMRLSAGDIIYVPPTGLTSWSRMVQKIIPGMRSLENAVIFKRASGI